ncbi:hypothetical protein TRFO_15568 [Tritrichomonas foetus]|uniref:RING-type domain-containing protein n=1 Tax=Tritrichomonas foetus TaxID=1144522 RepID=A0A1J4KRZ5_9EUKA|nr:hypothetical protein TRFO_15568 [Tritrichomonas foetus]|eukprot:OHT14065.1 hypothetical protein TRFO_15568 [Tritrichomonas foetus]
MSKIFHMLETFSTIKNIMQYLSPYALISASLWFAAISKLIVSSHSFYDICVILIEDQTYYFLSLNLIFVVLILLLRQFRLFTLGRISETIQQQLINETDEMMHVIFHLITTLNSNNISYLIPAIYCQILSRLFQAKVSQLLLLPNKSSAKIHQRLIFGQLCIIFVSYYNIIICLKHFPDRGYLNILIFLTYSFSKSIKNIINHVLTIYEVVTDVSSFKIYLTKAIIDLGASLFQILLHIIWALAEFVRFKTSSFINESILSMVLGESYLLLKKILKFHSYLIAIKCLKNTIPNATQEDINEFDDTCIVCRTQLKADNDVKKLPCGHCFHLECLQKWFYHQSKCPLCQQNILELLREEQKNAQNVHNVQDAQNAEGMDAEEEIREQSDQDENVPVFNFNDLDD